MKNRFQMCAVLCIWLALAFLFLMFPASAQGLAPTAVETSSDMTKTFYCYCPARAEQYYWMLRAAEAGEFTYLTAMREFFPFDSRGRSTSDWVTPAFNDQFSAREFLAGNMPNLSALPMPLSNGTHNFWLKTVNSIKEDKDYLTLEVVTYRRDGGWIEYIFTLTTKLQTLHADGYHSGRLEAEEIPLHNGMTAKRYADEKYRYYVSNGNGKSFDLSVYPFDIDKDPALVLADISDLDWIPCLEYMENTYPPLEEALDWSEAYRKRTEERWTIEKILREDAKAMINRGKDIESENADAKATVEELMTETEALRKENESLKEQGQRFRKNVGILFLCDIMVIAVILYLIGWQCGKRKHCSRIDS